MHTERLIAKLLIIDIRSIRYEDLIISQAPYAGKLRSKQVEGPTD